MLAGDLMEQPDLLGNMLNSTNDPVEQARITRELCESDCVNTILPPCAPMDQDIANFLNGAMQRCQQPGATTAAGASPTVHSFVALLSSVFLTGVAAVLH